MKYYSNKIFYSLIAIYILSIIMALVYWYVCVGWACWSVPYGEKCVDIKSKENIFNGLLPILFIVLSALIILLQQKIYRKIGYLTLVLLPLSPIFYKYIVHYFALFNIKRFLWFDVSWFFSGVSISGTSILQSIFFLIGAIMLFLISIIPFYVLGKLIKEDLFKKIAKR